VTAYGQPWWRIILVELDDYRRAAACRGIDMHSMEARQAGDPPQPSDRWTRTCQRFCTYYYLNFVPDSSSETDTRHSPAYRRSRSEQTSPAARIVARPQQERPGHSTAQPDFSNLSPFLSLYLSLSKFLSLYLSLHLSLFLALSVDPKVLRPTFIKEPGKHGPVSRGPRILFSLQHEPAVAVLAMDPATPSGVAHLLVFERNLSETRRSLS
jgi:hypothetical protein